MQKINFFYLQVWRRHIPHPLLTRRHAVPTHLLTARRRRVATASQLRSARYSRSLPSTRDSSSQSPFVSVFFLWPMMMKFYHCTTDRIMNNLLKLWSRIKNVLRGTLKNAMTIMKFNRRQVVPF